MYEWVLALVRILKGPKNFLESLWERQVVQENLATEELSFDKGLLTNDEIGGWHMFRVCWALVMALSFGNGSFEFLVKFV